MFGALRKVLGDYCKIVDQVHEAGIANLTPDKVDPEDEEEDL